MPSEELNIQCEKVKYTIKVTQAEVDYLADSTVKQSSSTVWHEQRKGRITASVAHRVIHTNQDQPAPSVIKTICHPDTGTLNTPAVSWGREKEPIAYKAYKDIVSPLHTECVIKETGLRICVDKPFIGASPDGIVTCECHGDGVIEIKCPYKFKDSSVSEMIASEGFYLSDTHQLKRTHPYFTQVQQQMYVFGCEYCHFVVWSNNACIVTHVARDGDFISDLIVKLETFWMKHCLPELLTHRMLKADRTISDNIPAVVDAVHCFCGQPDTDSVQMIGCDNDLCKYKWFHFPCVKVKRPPKGSWYCLECRRK